LSFLGAKIEFIFDTSKEKQKKCISTANINNNSEGSIIREQKIRISFFCSVFDSVQDHALFLPERL